MTVCAFVIEWCEETLDEQRYLPDTVRGILSINTLPTTGSCIVDFENCVYKGKMHARVPCWSDQQNVSHIKENGLSTLTHPLVDGGGRPCTILQWRQLRERPQDQRRRQQREGRWLFRCDEQSLMSPVTIVWPFNTSVTADQVYNYLIHTAAFRVAEEGTEVYNSHATSV